MAKPTIVPTFDTDQTNMTAPSSALLEDGWADDDIPTAGNHNWLFYWIGQWCKWLDDGVITFTDLTVSGTATINALHVIGHLDVDADVELSGIITTDITMDGDADVILDGGNLRLTNDAHILHEDDTIVFGFDPSILISATGGSVSHVDGVGGLTVDAATTAYFRLPVLPYGKRIKNLIVWGANQAGSGQAAVFTLMKYTVLARTYTPVADGEILESGTDVTITVSSPTASANDIYVLKVEADSSYYVNLYGGYFAFDQVS